MSYAAICKMCTTASILNKREFSVLKQYPTGMEVRKEKEVKGLFPQYKRDSHSQNSGGQRKGTL